MTISTLIRDRLDETGQSKTGAAKELRITRPTLETWLRGAIPEPESERAKHLASWLGMSESEMLALILLERGVDLTVLEDIANSDLAKIRLSVVGQTTHRVLADAA